MRRIALRDPAMAPEVVKRLAGDPDRDVRRAATADPRLPVPIPVLLRLLADPEPAGPAAANPALPVREMWRQSAVG